MASRSAACRFFNLAQLWSVCFLVVVGAGMTGGSPKLRGKQMIATPSEGNPYIMELRRESVPIHRNGKVVSFKTSYSGEMSLGQGSEAQSFRVVFDTGSGHVIVPSSTCQSETCRRHRRYNISQSSTAVAVNADGNPVVPNELCDQVTIGFGTGDVKGEFVKEKVCIGGTGKQRPGPCAEVNAIMAVDMTPQPFLSFNFDGIIGLGLGALSLSEDFSFFGLLSAPARARASSKWQSGSDRGPKHSEPHFGVFLTEGDDGTGSEIAFGGHSLSRLASPLAWAPVPSSELGYWQVEVLGVKIGGEFLDICRGAAGPCRGILDTGTSHLGVPAASYISMMNRLSTPAEETTDCKQALGPNIEILLSSGITLELEAENYMRKLPYGGSLGSSVIGNHDNAAGSGAAGPAKADANTPEKGEELTCKPKLMPVKLPEPMGANVFIFGEPVLHRYYTTYSWAGPQVGFGLAATPQNMKKAGAVRQGPEVDPDEADVPVFLAQLSVTVKRKGASKRVDQATAKRPASRFSRNSGMGLSGMATRAPPGPEDANARLAALMGATYVPSHWKL